MKKRKDRTASGETPDENPFAALAGIADALPGRKEAPAPPQSREGLAPREGLPWKVRRTRKGGWPLSVERRKGGKWVTILDRIEGDGKALLRELKRRLGSGGSFRDGTIELQGQQEGAVAAFLDDQAPSTR